MDLTGSLIDDGQPVRKANLERVLLQQLVAGEYFELPANLNHLAVCLGLLTDDQSR
jgi:hypothetical protein